MKSHTVVKGADRAKPLTRTERRAMQRVEQKQQRAKRSNSFAGRVSAGNLVGGTLTVLAVLSVLIYGIARSNGGSGGIGVADASALNPARSLLQVGKPAPNFTLRDANGKEYSLAAQRGHPVLLEFFAVWCPVCQAEAPIMSRLTSTYTPRGVRVWSILANPYGKKYEDSGRQDLSLATKDDLSWYATNFNVQHPQLIDPRFQTVNRYGISAYPGIYLVNGRGVITFAGSGHQGFFKLSMALDKMLGGTTMNMGQ